MSLFRSFTETVKSSVALLYTTSLITSDIELFDDIERPPDNGAELDIFLDVFLVPTTFQVVKEHLPGKKDKA